MQQTETVSGTGHNSAALPGQSAIRTALQSDGQGADGQTIPNSENYLSQSSNYVSMTQAPPQKEGTRFPSPYDEFQSTNEFASDDMWEEFFTVGPDFNSTDWDTFLVDLDEQMAGMGSGTQ